MYEECAKSAYPATIGQSPRDYRLGAAECPTPARESAVHLAMVTVINNAEGLCSRLNELRERLKLVLRDDPRGPANKPDKERLGSNVQLVAALFKAQDAQDDSFRILNDIVDRLEV